MERKKVTLPDLSRKKEQGIPITMLTAYDYPLAQAVDQAGIDLILVGDSYGMVVLGYNSTVPVTMEQMLTACQAVARGARRAFLIGDMPFMSYQADVAEAVRNAGRFIKEANMDAVKLEGGREVANTVRAITNAGIPVMGHIGLTPQSISQLGGYRTQGTTAAAAHELLDDALALQEAGCFAIVLEKVPDRVAEFITKRLHIPTIGIGAGTHTDGQVLVIHDLLGLFDRFLPKFAKQYAQLHGLIAQALNEYKTEVETRTFPAPEHTFAIQDQEWEAFLQMKDEHSTQVPFAFADAHADTSRVY
ncbi:MAG: 3-methyl-2-oxobutanoate hydroxymethyltransferase [Chloroflexi bacterium]|nr:3-methyl-2-oxobutanoate hydroxymethyltransferase [Chloroflexota bacterium]